MSIKKGLQAVARSPDRRRLGGLTLETAEGWPGREEDGSDLQSAMRVGAANRCITVLSTSMAVLPVFIHREGNHTRVEAHPLGELLQSRPNEAMTAFDMTRTLMGHELTEGNGYCWNRRARSGHVVERIPLAPQCVTPMVMPDGKLWYWYADPKSGDLIRLAQEDISHYKAFSLDGLEGVSIFTWAARTLAASEAAGRHELAVWRSGGRPSGVLSTDTDLGGTVEVPKADGTTEIISKKERIRREWERVHRGPDNAFRLAVLDLGLQYKPIAMTAADAQYVETSELRVVDICRFCGVPPYLVYAGKESYESNEQHGIDYVNYTLQGYETQWSQEDTYKLLTPAERREEGLRVRRELKVFLRGNTEAQVAWLRAMRDLGAYSVDEIRALDDRPPVPGGDVRLGSLNYVPLESFDELSRQRARREGGSHE